MATKGQLARGSTSKFVCDVGPITSKQNRNSEKRNRTLKGIFCSYFAHTCNDVAFVITEEYVIVIFFHKQTI